MNKFTSIEDSALDQVTGGGFLSELLEAPIAKADEAIDVIGGILTDAKDFISDIFGRLGGLVGLN